MAWGHIGVTLADTVVALASLQVGLGTLWNVFGQTKAILGHIGPLCAHFGCSLESLRRHFGNIGVTLASLWGALGGLN